jgi:hypothetical protein
MPLTADDARRIAEDFRGLARELMEYRLREWDALSFDERQQLRHLQQSLLNHASHMTGQALLLALAQLESDLETITTVTGDLRKRMRALQKVGQIITLATSGVTLAAAIATGSPPAILQAARDAARQIGELRGSPAPF